MWCIVYWLGVGYCESRQVGDPMHSLGGSTAQDHTFRLIQRPSGSTFARHDGRGVEQMLRTQLRTFQDAMNGVTYRRVSNRCYTQRLRMFDGAVLHVTVCIRTEHLEQSQRRCIIGWCLSGTVVDVM